MSIYMPVSQITSPCFQHCSLQIPGHPVKSLVTTYKSMKICTSDHLFPDAVENQREVSLHYALSGHLLGGLMILTIHSYLVPGVPTEPSGNQAQYFSSSVKWS